MDIREFLNIDSSRLNADILVDKIEEDPDVFDTVWDIMFEDSYPLSMRAGRVVYLFCQKHPYFVEPRVDDIMHHLPSVRTESVIRNLLGILSVLKLPDKHIGRLFDFCYSIIESSGAAIAHKAYALTILYNISELEPGLKPELISLFEGQMDTESSGIKSRTLNLLKKLYGEV
jgi:hypothetical protein